MSPRTIERVTRTAPLGVRPRDVATGRAVTDGLRLTEIGHGRVAIPNRSGVLVFHDLPGLGAVARGRGDDAFWAAPPDRAAFVLELTDLDGRYLPFRLRADAPARGLFAGRCPHLLWPPPDDDDDDVAAPASPPDGAAAAIPLFSAPARPVPAGLAAVRADLWDAALEAPAAWAVLEVSARGGRTALGIADRLGRVLVLLAYPEPRGATGGSPPGSRALVDETWPLRLAVRYGASSPPAGSAPVAPDLCAVLGQPQGAVLLDDAPVTPFTGAMLEFGRELTLRSVGRSVLLVSPGPGEPDA